MRCRKIRKLIDIYLDNEIITTGQQEQLFAHIRACPECLKYFEENERMQELVSSAPTVSLPANFRSTLMFRLQTEGEDDKKRLPLFRWAFLSRLQKSIAVSGVASLVGIILLLFTFWYARTITTNPNGLYVAQLLQIDVVSPHEGTVVEPDSLDISAAFYSLEHTLKPDLEVRILLDAKDVTDATEVNEDYIIYTPSTLESGHHLATVQLLDESGMPVAQRSWTFYVLPPSIEEKHDI